jgi:hypothetical protein
MSELRMWQMVAGWFAFTTAVFLGAVACKDINARANSRGNIDDGIEIKYKVGPDGLNCYVAVKDGNPGGLWCR